MTFWVSLASAVVAFAAYAVTASRTITWWDGSSYPLAACTLGITGAPGSLLLTLLGWLATRVPLVHPVAFQLNLFAGLMAACLVGLVTRLSIVLATPEGRPPGPRELIAGGVAGLTLAFSVSVWSYAVQFTPYVLTALFTGLILTVALEWWRRAATSDAASWLFALFLLFGLDFSVHRTNLLLLPAALVWVTLGRPSLGRRAAPWTAAVAGLALGLAFQLLTIPIARRDPLFNIDDPRDLRSLWSYISLDRVGGGFLIQLFPRKADFFRVQLGDYVGVMRRNLWPTVSSPVGALPLLLGLFGWFSALRGTPRRALGMLVFFVCASLGAVVYFNLPAHYFRNMDRHYLPSLVVFVPLIGLGVATLLRLVGGTGGAMRERLALGLGAVLLLVPAGEWAVNRGACDYSRVRFAETYSRDVLETLPQDAILLTNGDNDSFPLWYLQQVEGIRRDVTVINLPSTNMGTYLGHLRRHDPYLSQLLSRERGVGILRPVTLPDSVVTIPVDPQGALGLPDSVILPESIAIRIGGEFYGSDRVVMDLLQLNRWRRPVLLACTVSRDGVTWLWPYARLEGMSYRIVPSADPAVEDLPRLRKVLMELVHYAGVADSTIPLDSVSKPMCANYVASLQILAIRELSRDDPERCLATLRFLEQRLPPKRLGMPEGFLDPLRKQAVARLREKRKTGR
jgi:hypothetical protein